MDDHQLAEEVTFETAAAADVARRLGKKYPTLSASTVARVVKAEFRALTGPVRGFVPLLAEHEARDVLADLHRRGDPREGL